MYGTLKLRPIGPDGSPPPYQLPCSPALVNIPANVLIKLDRGRQAGHLGFGWKPAVQNIPKKSAGGKKKNAQQ